MDIIIAGAMLLVAFVTGAISFMIAPHFAETAEENGEETKVNNKIPLAAAISSFFSKENLWQIIFSAAAALLCAVAAYRIALSGTDYIYIYRCLLVALVLLCVFIIDRKTHRIPNFTVLAIFAVGAVELAASAIIYGKDVFMQSLIGSAVGLMVCLVSFYIMARLTKNGIGMGDVKLISTLGWTIGLSATLFTVLLALLICAATAAVLLIRKKKNKNDTLAFGPFVFFGYILLMLFLL